MARNASWSPMAKWVDGTRCTTTGRAGVGDIAFHTAHLPSGLLEEAIGTGHPSQENVLQLVTMSEGVGSKRKFVRMRIR